MSIETATRPASRTADGEPYDSRLEYFFWDASDSKVKSTDDHYLEGPWIVDQMDRRIVPLGELHRSKDNAIEAGQKQCLRRIETLKGLIESLESQKSPGKRTLKYRLMSRQH
jgi:hypothetical protein